MLGKVAAIAAVLVLTIGSAFAQKRADNDEAEIKRVEAELEIALSKGDSSVLNRILADDYVEIDAQGNVKNKSDVIALARARNVASRGVKVGPEKQVNELSIHTRGNTSLVIGRATTRYQFMDYLTPSATQSQAPVNLIEERFIRSYSKVGGRWELMAWQTTAIPNRQSARTDFSPGP